MQPVPSAGKYVTGAERGKTIMQPVLSAQEESDKVKKIEEEQKPELETLKKQPDRMGGHNKVLIFLSYRYNRY